MKTTHRSYAEESGDFTRLCRFIVEPRAHVRAHSTWCIGRVVDWKYGLYDSKLAVADFCDQNAHFWFDAFGDLVGVAISENGDSSFAIITAPGFRFLFEAILDWVLDAWADRGPRFTTEITEYQDIELRVLERREFRCESSFSTRRFDLTRPLARQFALEPGFTIVDMRSHPDYRAQRILRADAFDIPVYFFSGIYDYTVNYTLAKDYFEKLQAPVKGFYTFERSAHSPIFEEPEKVRKIMQQDVLVGTNNLADAK